MKNSIFSIALIVLLSGCSSGMKYDVSKWNDESDRATYKYRNAMLDDLLENHNPKGMNVRELEELFGYIEYDSTSNGISFEVYQEWDMIDPSYTKYLNLRLNKNKIVDSVYFTEYQK